MGGYIPTGMQVDDKKKNKKKKSRKERKTKKQPRNAAQNNKNVMNSMAGSGVGNAQTFDYSANERKVFTAGSDNIKDMNIDQGKNVKIPNVDPVSTFSGHPA